jgi:hypothetical protein
MKNRWKYFFIVLAFWEILVFGIPLLMLLRARSLRRGDETLLCAWFLVGLTGTVLVWLMVKPWLTSSSVVALAAILGGVLPVLGALLWNALDTGFEESPAHFIGALLMSGPSAVAGGVAGWLRLRVLRKSRAVPND